VTEKERTTDPREFVIRTCPMHYVVGVYEGVTACPMCGRPLGPEPPSYRAEMAFFNRCVLPTMFSDRSSSHD